MANVLSTDKKIAVIAELTEGSSIRSIERMTGIHRDTIMCLGVKVTQGCSALLDETMRNLPCTRLEMDEADRIYAWIHDADDPAKPKRHVTVLHVPPVVSPQTAVKAAIVQEFKERANAN